jgi:hypothetical protein
MGTICGARKTFLELTVRIRIPLELIDLQQETYLQDSPNYSLPRAWAATGDLR